MPVLKTLELLQSQALNPTERRNPMRIKELAEATGVDVDTIRYYEKQSLLPEPARQDNGYRDYASAHLERLAFIRHGRALDGGRDASGDP